MCPKQRVFYSGANINQTKIHFLTINVIQSRLKGKINYSRQDTYYIMTNSTYKEDTTVLKLYAMNNTVSKQIKQ